jgi:hypothetical protein
MGILVWYRELSGWLDYLDDWRARTPGVHFLTYRTMIVGIISMIVVFKSPSPRNTKES